MSINLTLEPDEMRERFFALLTARDVATLLDVSYSVLTYHLYRTTTAQKYTTFTIPKRSGGQREIKAPISPIKILQQKLNVILQQVYYHKEPVHGFIPKHSIISNAKRHERRTWILNVDLVDFFPTITFQRIRGMLLKKPYVLGEGAATVIAQLCCCDGHLPQGAPSSPIISNMICSKLDGELSRLAQRNGCHYTRYADDLTFSTTEEQFPMALARKNHGGDVVIGSELIDVITYNWFSVNVAKVKLRHFDAHQEVTGLTVNQKVNVRRRYVRQIRAMLHSWEKDGLTLAGIDYVQRHTGTRHVNPRKPAPELTIVLRGKLAFLRQVVGETNPVYLRYHKQFERLSLLQDFQDQEANPDRRERGFIFEKLVQRLFALSEVETYGPFRKNGEQIDGACKYDGHYYLVECKWREALSGHEDTDVLHGRMDRAGADTWGIFISVNGWSDNVPTLLREGTRKSIILMNGSDIQHVLRDRLNLGHLIEAKRKRLQLYSEPYYDAINLL